jgi:glycine cleavage system H protein
MNVPDNLKYQSTHEWVNVDGDTARVGISDYAQDELTDIVYVELPDAGREVKAGEAVCVLESTKIAADVYSPLTGKITRVNEALQDDPSLVNSSPFDQGWLFEIEVQDKSEIGNLLSPEQYREKISA